MEKNGRDNLGMVLPEQNLQELKTGSATVRVNIRDEDKVTGLKDEKTEEETKNIVLKVRKVIYTLSQQKFVRNFLVPLLFHSLVVTYVVLAVLHWYRKNRQPLVPYDGLGLLLVIAIISYWSLFYYRYAKPFFCDCSFAKLKPSAFCFPLLSSVHRNSIFVFSFLLILLFLIYDAGEDINRLRSSSGIVAIIFCAYCFSKYPSHIKWDIVFKGLLIQFFMALLTVRWAAGKLVLEKVGEKFEKFLSFSYDGAAFVYSDDLVYQHKVFAFQSLSVIFFVSFVVEVLFHLQILQRMFSTLGWFLQKAMGTTAVESINCCVSVFLGLTEALIVIKPYLSRLTESEMQAVMLGQLSTVAGSVFAAYASFGVNPGYLITASIMSAPAALALSKMLYPEREESKTTAEMLSMENVHKGQYTSALTAGCDGAITGVKIVGGIIASLIAFISFMSFGDAVVSWGAALIGFENVTIVSILTNVFTPVAYLLGVDASQCRLVGELISRKVIINEFVAYKKLGTFKAANLLSRRSEAIATYALCSFSNPGSVACQIAGIAALCPSRLELATKLAFRAYIGGIVTCFITASIAGLLTPSDVYNVSLQVAANSTNFTMLAS